MERAEIWFVLTIVCAVTALAIVLALDSLLNKRRLTREFDFKHYKRLENR